MENPLRSEGDAEMDLTDGEDGTGNKASIDDAPDVTDECLEDYKKMANHCRQSVV